MIGVCKDASDITELVARTTGKQLKKRDITLVDQSGSAVSLFQRFIFTSVLLLTACGMFVLTLKLKEKTRAYFIDL